MKQTLLLILILLSFLPSLLFSDHFHINGKYTIQNSKVNLIYTIPINAPTENLSITLYHISNFTNGVNKQIVSAYSPRISPKPDHIKNFTDSYGNTGVIITYSYIKSDIRVESNFIFDSVVDIENLDDFYEYPLNNSSTRHVKNFLKQSKLSKVKSKSFDTLVYKIVGQSKNQMEAVLSILAWIKNNIQFNHKSFDDSAHFTYKTKSGNRNGILNLSIAMLRTAGIPCRFVNGLSLNHSYLFFKKNSTAEINLTESMKSHTILLDNNAEYNSEFQYPKSIYNWLEIYFPNRNWVAFDPFATYFFVPCNLLRRNVALDSNDLKDEAKDDYIPYPINVQFFAELTSIGGDFYIQHHQSSNIHHFIMPGIPIESYPFVEKQFGSSKTRQNNNQSTSFLTYNNHFENNNHEQLDIKIISGFQYAQAFTIVKDINIKEIKLPLFRFNNSPQGEIWLEIYKSSSDFSDKTKMQGQSQKLQISNLLNNGNYNWVSFSMNELKLKPGKYWILIKLTSQEIILWRGIFANPYNSIKDTVYFHNNKPLILYSPFLDLNFQIIE